MPFQQWVFRSVWPLRSAIRRHRWRCCSAGCIVENTVALIPNGFTIQGYMPFLNGVYGTGQEIVVMPPWGCQRRTVYCAGIAVLMFQ